MDENNPYASPHAYPVIDTLDIIKQWFFDFVRLLEWLAMPPMFAWQNYVFAMPIGWNARLNLFLPVLASWLIAVYLSGFLEKRFLRNTS